MQSVQIPKQKDLPGLICANCVSENQVDRMITNVNPFLDYLIQTQIIRPDLVNVPAGGN